MLQPAPVQTTYIRYLFPAQNGMLASEHNFAADTRIVETAAGIGFGLAVSQGVNDDGCIIGGSAYVGVTRAKRLLALTYSGARFVQKPAPRNSCTSSRARAIASGPANAPTDPTSGCRSSQIGRAHV